MTANHSSINCHLMMMIFWELILKWPTKIFKLTRSLLRFHIRCIFRRNMIYMKSFSNSSLHTDVSICFKAFTKSSRSPAKINMSLNYFPYYYTNFCKYVSKCPNHSNNMNYFTFHQCMMKLFNGKLYRIIITLQNFKNRK